MKILAVSNGYVPAWAYGGPIQSVHQLCRGLIEAGEDVTVYATDLNGSAGQEGLGAGINIVDSVPVHYFKVDRFQRFGFSAELTRELKEKIKDFDLVHLQGIFVYPSLIAARLCQKRAVPYVMTPRGVLDPYCFRYQRLKKKLYYQLFEKKNLEHAHFVHFTSELELRRTAHLKLKMKPVVIPNCLDTRPFSWAPFQDRYSNAPSSKNHNTLLFLGRIHFKKGLDLLVDAFHQITRKYRDWQLVIAGPDDGGYLKQLQRRIFSSGIKDSILLAGLVTGEKKHKLLATTDILVLPSYHENFGMSAVEAMAAGIPIVISHEVQISQEVKEAQAGLVCDCKVASLQDSLERLMSNPMLRQEMGRNGRQLVSARYSLEKVIPQMRELYRKATG